MIMALTQVLGVSAVSLISQAVGRKDQEHANLVFNQSLVLSAVCAVITLLGDHHSLALSARKFMWKSAQAIGEFV